MVLTKTHKRLISLFFAIAAFVLFCVNSLLIFVVTGPRSLNAITPYIESALTPPGSPYHVKVESSELIWDGWRHPIAIHAKNVEIMDDKGMDIARFPEVGVSMYFFKLLTGTIDLKSIEVLHPTALFIQGDDGSLSFGFSQAENAANNSLSMAFALLTADAGANPVTHLKSLTIRHASLSVKKSHGGVFLQSPDASLEITRKNGNARGTLMMPLRFDQRSGELDADFSLSRRDKTVTAEVVYTDIPSTLLQQLFPTQHWMESARMPTSGWAHVTSDFDANIAALDFMLEAGPGVFEYPSQFEAPLQIRRIRVEGSLTDKLSVLTIKKGLLDIKPFFIAFSGAVHKQGDDYGVDGHAEVANVPVDNLHLYWPLTLSPHTRKWVTDHITQGKIEKAKITAHFKPGDLKLKDTPEQAIDAMMEVKNATVKYMSKHPPVSEVSGVIKFTGDSMDAKIGHAKYMSDTTVSSARIRFPDLNASDVRMFMDMDMNTSAKDTVEFLSLPDLDKAKKLNLTHDITGHITGNAKLDFIAFSDKDDNGKFSSLGAINYAISAELHDVSQKGFMGKRDVENANMKINLNNKGIKAEGRARINQVPMDINLTTSFAHDHETTYTVKTNMPVDRLPDFGLPAFDAAKGSMEANVTFVSSDTAEKADATADLTQTSISLPEHGFSKKVGVKATLQLATERMASGNTLIKSFLFKSNDVLVSGKAEFDKSINDFSLLTFDTLRFGHQDLSYLDYAKTSGGIKLDVKGRSLDVTPYLFKTQSKGPQRAYDINIKTDRLIMGDGRVMQNADIQADCGEECRSVNISAKLPDATPFTYTLAAGQLNASCDNAGELLRVLGIFDGIDGGKMSIKGEYKEGKIDGILLMKDYTLKNAPVLTKIFTIASLSGILDTLSGNGIAFAKLSAPFAYQHNILVLKDAKAHGSALGITTDGVINMGAGKLDLSGTLVPSYTMNSLVGNIPLIGTLLVGGKGKGIIAINYSVKGDMKDPSVSVNPLSVLTPGFLRNIFDIFDEPAPDLDKIAADQKLAEEKKKEEESKAATTPTGSATSSAPASSGTPASISPPAP